MAIRKVEVAIISDVHLGTFGSRASELMLYLESIHPKTLIINGDLVDIWQFRKRYFPKSHLAILQKIFSLAATGIPVYFIPGNHDDLIRKFGDFSLGNLHIQNELILNIGGEKVWFHHGDKYDKSVSHQGLAAFGGRIYEGFILLEKGFNWLLKPFGMQPIQMAKKIKSFSKKISKTALDFETMAIDEAILREFDVMVCGHVHKPQNQIITKNSGSLLYLNSGDWVENLTALEYENNRWKVVRFSDLSLEEITSKTIVKKTISQQTEDKVFIFDLN
ncbi:MAG: UDP-2,3-diacylglucosamine pyrophosphatase LpxH [Cognaticolwellia sp.]|jgi:UDP-2,3-diacylglucosamine pyrophosphatase LpxH